MGQKHKKEYLSEPINKELAWIKDIKDKDIRLRLKELDLSISLAYTYFIYYDYTVKELARINQTTEKRIIAWILICAYIVDGGKYDFGTGIGLRRKEWALLFGKYPKAKDTLPCHRCVWADTRTGRVVCFRYCRGYNNFQSK